MEEKLNPKILCEGGCGELVPYTAGICNICLLRLVEESLKAKK